MSGSQMVFNYFGAAQRRPDIGATGVGHYLYTDLRRLVPARVQRTGAQRERAGNYQ
jgi:hypothetical protein